MEATSKKKPKRFSAPPGYGILYLRLHLTFGGRIGGYIRDPGSKIGLPGQAQTTVFYPDWRLAGPICHCTAYVVMDGTKPIGAQPPRPHVKLTVFCGAANLWAALKLFKWLKHGNWYLSGLRVVSGHSRQTCASQTLPNSVMLTKAMQCCLHGAGH